MYSTDTLIQNCTVRPNNLKNWNTTLGHLFIFYSVIKKNVLQVNIYYSVFFWKITILAFTTSPQFKLLQVKMYIYIEDGYKIIQKDSIEGLRAEVVCALFV